MRSRDARLFSGVCLPRLSDRPKTLGTLRPRYARVLARTYAYTLEPPIPYGGARDTSPSPLI